MTAFLAIVPNVIIKLACLVWVIWFFTYPLRKVVHGNELVIIVVRFEMQVGTMSSVSSKCFQSLLLIKED